MTEPLLNTSKGNIPYSELRREVQWSDEPTFSLFTELYFFGDELVRINSAVVSKTGYLNVDEPVIYTSEGNLPVRELRRVEQIEGATEYLKRTERFFRNGVEVKASADVYSRKPLESVTEQQQL